MTADLHPGGERGDERGVTRRAVDELIRRSAARPVASIEDLSRFRADLWDSDEELEAFLGNVRAARTTEA